MSCLAFRACHTAIFADSAPELSVHCRRNLSYAFLQLSSLSRVLELPVCCVCYCVSWRTVRKMPPAASWVYQTSGTLQLGPYTPVFENAYPGKSAAEIAGTLLADIVANSTLPNDRSNKSLSKRLQAHKSCLHLKQGCAKNFLHVDPYPVMKFDSGPEIKTCRLHRLMLCLRLGNPPEDLPYALHGDKCGTDKCCFNPYHLRWGNAQHNNSDKRGKRKIQTRSHTASCSGDPAAQPAGYTARPSRLCSRLCMVMGLGNMVTAVI